MATPNVQPKRANKAVPIPPYPVDGPGFTQLSNLQMYGLVAAIPVALKLYFGISMVTMVILTAVLALPMIGIYLVITSWALPVPHSSVRLPGRPIEDYLTFRDADLAAKFNGRKKIPMELFFENYIEGKIDVNGDFFETFEARYDWASFPLHFGQVKFFLTQWIPELLWHSRVQDESQVRDHYDRGDDFYAAFLGPSMIYTSGLISDPSKEETLEQLQENKLKNVCELLQLREGERHLDIGCGWGTLVAYASKNCKTDSTGVTLGRNQTAFGNNRAAEYGVADTARLICQDYRDITRRPRFNKISCLEMAEHVGIRKFQDFLLQVKDMLEDDGLFYLQIAGLRAAWQFEDFVWGLFMAKYVFPGADASCPLYWVTKQLETAGFEVRSVDTIGVHYSATIDQWYKNWMKNKDQIVKSYGKRWFRLWQVFLGWSVIIARQGSSTCYQILAHKNSNAFDRTTLIKTTQA
ncbi:hypothetical protein IWQ60_010448 [Tieghemiomyces parasiticus]|uniref:sphingolipid C(9)-methyltransferase n=1 Tax=Tieghemiomyces parasiticus TaxID=78921 RepID=A0A9W8DMX9_9FUNG|nr:hypothetical protein IWQ60_010448 [Tieghemiomyces parasiticus]